MHASPVQPWHQALFHQSDTLPRSQGHFEKPISSSDQPNNRRWARTHQNRVTHASEVSELFGVVLLITLLPIVLNEDDDGGDDDTESSCWRLVNHRGRRLSRTRLRIALEAFTFVFGW